MLRSAGTSSDTQPPAGFAIVRRELDECTSAISVEGELDLSTAPKLRWMLIDALEGGARRIVVDLSLVTFMDSTALGVLVAVNRRLDPGARLAIVCAQSNVLQIFEYSGTDGAFAIHPTLEQALAHLQGHTAQAG